jgi:hypothetical protein
LRTFCISNVLYWGHREEPASTALPFLQLSGIPEVRQHCIGIVAESHLRATLEYIRNEIPAFLGSVQLWIQAGSGNANAERKQQIIDTVSAVESRLDEASFAVR